MALASDREFRKGHAALLLLALFKDQTRQGYEIGNLIAGALNRIAEVRHA
jgi:DNA-binding PadR family transcriptional regulator